jgi:hypothetical protein
MRLLGDLHAWICDFRGQLYVTGALPHMQAGSIDIHKNDQA